MNDLLTIGMALLCALIILVPAIVIVLRMGRKNDAHPWHEPSKKLLPLTNRCDICHEIKTTRGLSRKYVFTTSASTWIGGRSYLDTKTERARIPASVCECCYQENAATIKNKLKGRGLFASLERWHNKNNPMYIEEMVVRIAKNKFGLIFPVSFGKRISVRGVDTMIGSYEMWEEDSWDEYRANNPPRTINIKTR